ncbi:MAG: hypothetical protein LBS98_05675 [Coriobacteriales bacterium]|jgi:hypothetical protein|nr:hypothetical protein [Coriobacteriales bacterium]
MHEHKQTPERGEVPEHDHGHDGHDHLHAHEHSHADHSHAGHTHSEHNHSEHSHADHDHSNPEGEVQLTEHEGALVASLVRDVAGSFDDIKTSLAKSLAKLADWVSENGGAVGHIKASLTDGTTIATLSTTGGAVSITAFPNPSPEPAPALTPGTQTSDPCHAEVAVIVLGVDAEALKTVVDTVLSSVLTPA